MKEIISALDLSKNAANIYHSCLGQPPLSYDEIHTFEPNLSVDEFNQVIEELFEKNYLIAITPEESIVLPHYLAIPTFSTLLGNLTLDSGGENGSLQQTMEKDINEIIQNEKRIEIESIYDNFQKVLKEMNNTSAEIRKEAEDFVASSSKQDFSSEIVSNFEVELKKTLGSQYNSLLDSVTQFKTLVLDILKASNFNPQQMESLEKVIKNDLEDKIQEKSKEIDGKISNKFNELSENFNKVISDMMNNQVEQKAISLGILNFVDKQMSNLNKSINVKRESFKIALNWLGKGINDKIINTLQTANADIANSVSSLNKFFIQLLSDYFTLNDFCTENSAIKIKEEISTLLSNLSEDTYIFVPNISEYLPLQELMETTGKYKIRIISSDPHSNSLVQELKKISGIEYKRIRFNKFVGIKSANIAIIGEINKNEDDPLKNLNGIGTNSISLIELIEPLLLEKWKEGKLSKEDQIVTSFNHVIENINDIIGNEIGKIFQNIMDITFKMEGISLNVLEIKLLISKLKRIDTPLDDDKKNEVIEQVRNWNDKFTKQKLLPTPEFRAPYSKDGIRQQPILGVGSLLEEPESIDLEKIDLLFELFLEKAGDLKGVDISKQIQNMINFSLKFQGFSKILEWKDNLSSVDSVLEEPFKEKLIEDFKNWKNDILRPKVSKIPALGTDTQVQTQVKAQIEEEIEEEPYVSAGMTQTQYSEEDTQSEEEKLDLGDLFQKVVDNLDNSTGAEISKVLQDISDALVESHGPMASRATRQWISKLRSIRAPLEDDMKLKFSEDFARIKSKYVSGEDEEDDLSDYTPGFMDTESISIETQDGGKEGSETGQLFDKIIEELKTLKGNELTKDLQEIADFVMENFGPVAARDIRPWISKLRSMRAPLEEDIKVEFSETLEKWKEKFS